VLAKAGRKKDEEKDRQKVRTVTVAEKFRPEEKHKKAGQGRKDRTTSRESREEKYCHKEAVRQSTDKQEFVLASSKQSTNKSKRTYRHAHTYTLCLIRKFPKPHWCPVLQGSALRYKTSPSLHLLVLQSFSSASLTQQFLFSTSNLCLMVLCCPAPHSFQSVW